MTAPSAVLALTAIRGAYGVALGTRPGQLARLVAGTGQAGDGQAGDGQAGDGQARPAETAAVMRVLAGRHLAQAGLTAARPTASVLGAGAGADLLHAGSMLALAAISPRCRRLALTDALIESALAAAGLVLTAQAGR